MATKPEPSDNAADDFEYSNDRFDERLGMGLHFMGDPMHGGSAHPSGSSSVGTIGNIGTLTSSRLHSSAAPSTMLLDTAGVDEELFDIFQMASGVDPASYASFSHLGADGQAGVLKPSPSAGVAEHLGQMNLNRTDSLPMGSASLNLHLPGMGALGAGPTPLGLSQASSSSGVPPPPSAPPTTFNFGPGAGSMPALSLSSSSSPPSFDASMLSGRMGTSIPINVTGAAASDKKKKSYNKVTTKKAPSVSLSSSLPKSTPSAAQYTSPYYSAAKTPTSSSTASALAAQLEDDDSPGGPEDSDRLQRRLARKAELARASRRRKKMYVHDLEVKVKQLGAKIEELQRKQAKTRAERRVEAISGEEKERKENQLRIREKLAEIVKSKKLDEPTQQQLNTLIRKFVENSRLRQSKVDYYMDRVEECLMPGLQVKFALWGLDQNDEFYAKPGLWTSLMYNEVGVTEEQMRLIISRREAIHQERRNLANCQRMLKEVKERINGHMQGLNRQMDALQNVLTPWQLAKFYVWVEENEWCMQMLNSMWAAQPVDQ